MKKSMYKILVSFFTILLILSSGLNPSSAHGESNKKEQQVKKEKTTKIVSLKASEKLVKIAEGEKIQLKVYAKFSKQKKQTDVTNSAGWKSSKSSIVTVKEGLFTAVKTGKATVTATYKGKSVKIQVKVIESDEPVKVELTADKTTLKADNNDAIVLSAKIYNKDNKEISSESIEYFADNIKITDNKFKTSKAGQHKLTAKIGKIVSNEILVTADMVLSSAAIDGNNVIQTKYANYGFPGGNNVSIPLKWSEAPEGTKSYAILMYDVHPVADNWVHWAVVNIPVTVTSLLEGVSNTTNMPLGSLELYNSFSTKGYGGPQPPAGTGVHDYKIVLYALNTEKIDPGAYPTYYSFKEAVKGKVVKEIEITGKLGH